MNHLPAGGWLDVETATEAGSAVLVVSNSGPLVAADAVETLFLPFRRLQGERTGPSRGFGLGLSIVRAVATAHGGDVSAEARPAGGLTVTVALPAS